MKETVEESEPTAHQADEEVMASDEPVLEEELDSEELEVASQEAQDELNKESIDSEQDPKIG